MLLGFKVLLVSLPSALGIQLVSRWALCRLQSTSALLSVFKKGVGVGTGNLLRHGVANRVKVVDLLLMCDVRLGWYW